MLQGFEAVGVLSSWRTWTGRDGVEQVTLTLTVDNAGYRGVIELRGDAETVGAVQLVRGVELRCAVVIRGSKLGPFAQLAGVEVMR
jgi:hypothetical protein